MGIPVPGHEQLLSILLVFLRVSAILFIIPVIGERTVPVRVKAALAIIITMIIYPIIKFDKGLAENMHGWAIIAASAGEVFVGITVGFVARLVFAGIQYAGEMVGVQMGFSMVNIIDPVSSTQVSIIAEFQYVIALLVYLAVDAHHLFISAMLESYKMVMPLSYHFSGSLMQAVSMFSAALFVIAVKIAAPVMAVLLFTNTALGIIARTVPQINIFIVGFPLQIATGLIFLGLTAPILVAILQMTMNHMSFDIQTVLKLLSQA